MRTIKAISCLSAGLAALLIITAAHADVIITLKNGTAIAVDVDQKDVASISFEDSAPDQQNNPAITWDFETGDLTGWATTGEAFRSQPTYGDNPTARNRGQASNHQGNYWIGGYENRPTPQDPAGRTQGDSPKGTLTSSSFVIEKPTIDFLLGGGCDINSVRVVLVIDGAVYRKSTGKCTETMVRETWDVSDLIGRKAMIRLVDNAGGGWGHINFDDLRFY
jgi:hypothetical protein